LISYDNGLQSVSKVKKSNGGDGESASVGDYKIVTYLNHEMGIGTLVQVESDTVTGTMRVVTYSHKISDNDFSTEIVVVAA
ncbi:hypothetical protein, partial [Methanoregula sp.]|uniref:hypothetical protein n=1 Tax=Methanoregula sp. TaxID=2052170 RepID=UPI0025F5CCED